MLTRVTSFFTNVLELWALYKEVQQYYEKGLKIPDDVTLLFADDNFGTIRRLPFGDELQRSGGAGVCSRVPFRLIWVSDGAALLPSRIRRPSAEL